MYYFLKLKIHHRETADVKWRMQVSCKDFALPDVLQVIQKHSSFVKTDVFKLAKVISQLPSFLSDS